MNPVPPGERKGPDSAPSPAKNAPRGGGFLTCLPGHAAAFPGARLGLGMGVRGWEGAGGEEADEETLRFHFSQRPGFKRP